jgi:hypothetical protein
LRSFADTAGPFMCLLGQRDLQPEFLLRMQLPFNLAWGLEETSKPVGVFCTLVSTGFF